MPGTRDNRRSSFPNDAPRAIHVEPMIGVHVLADQRHLAHAGIREPLDFGNDFFHWP